MTEVRETVLPGVGVRHDFQTSEGVRLGVLTYRGGRRELLVYDGDDPDACRLTLRMSREDTRVLADLLGVSPVQQQVAAMERLEGLALDWIEVGPAVDGQTIGDLAIRTRTGVSIVAVIRGDSTEAAPDPTFELHHGDTAVVVGRPDGIAHAESLLSR